MAGPAPQAQETWSSQLTFLMASVGFAVGLGNIWRFPYVTGENGGSAFIIVYLLCAFIIGVPLVMAEWSIGRRSRNSASAPSCISDVASQGNVSNKWSVIGDIAVLAVFMLMLTYTVVASWTFDYFIRAVSGSFNEITAAGSTSMFQDLMASPGRLMFWHAVVVVITVAVNSKGITAGIEKAVNVLIPSLFICILLMVVYSFFVGDIASTFDFLLTPDFSKINASTILLAIGQAFFSIGIAMAVMITYGSYLTKDTSIPQNAFIVVSADTFVALIAGFAIFPIVFSYGLQINSGPGLVFETLPLAFGGLPGGQVFGAIFFMLLIAAALTSCISNFAPVNAWCAEKFKMSHTKAAIVSGIVMWVFGLVALASLNILEDVRPLGFIEKFADMTIFNIIDYFAANILFPFGALLTSIFIGWILPPHIIQEEIGLSKDSKGYKLWINLMRYFIPVAISIIFYMSATG
ncbi:sodium-dependent transporter [Pseudemcibacter aquimaris]|uniref:sodium-dependent transporter n=1 Tax=Pseudemcibacter aquimaris TaxID=2857064 RepID=UPI002012DF36|nr:sodium-dependent transporter [Pseudemcibacter aquimaris]MCC3862422.1 sodium-dependent transporter [Pseudemcibacter aquimaris]WDU59148.1 sodium-dependent transporter [Pseudemcibacter aquimaris]